MTAPQLATSASSAQAAQAGLVILLADQIAQAMGTIDVQHLEQSLPKFKTVVAALVHKYGAGSAALAARFYKQQRASAGIDTPFAVRPADLPPLAQIGQSVDWATQPLWSGQPNIPTATTNVQGVAENLVLGVGRETVIDNAKVDPEARGWARVTEPNPCYFCALLATRGAVYKEDTASFKSHDHCRCHAEPVFTSYEPSAEIRKWRADYAKATRSVSGSHNKQLAWRQAFEGRQSPN